jgi:hypothetical protein
MASTSTSDHDDKAFEFFKLPRELRDLIYEQTGMLKQQTQLQYEHNIANASKPLSAIKMHTSLLLVSRQFNKEYRESRESQVGLCLSIDLISMSYDFGQSEDIPQEAAAEAHVLHLHVGWWDPWSSVEQKDCWSGLHARLLEWSSHMPKLHAITVDLYMNTRLGSEYIKITRRGLTKLRALKPLVRARVIIMEGSEQWEVHNHPGKKLLVQWNSGDPSPPRFNDPPVEFFESCCDHFFTGNLADYDDYDDLDEMNRRLVESGDLNADEVESYLSDNDSEVESEDISSDESHMDEVEEDGTGGVSASGIGEEAPGEGLAKEDDNDKSS